MPAFDERFLNNESEQLIYSEHLVRYQLAVQMVAGKTVLDIACGSGYGSALLAASAAQVVGADIDPQTIKADQSFYQKPNLSFALADAENLPVEWTGRFDIVVSLETIEHLESADKYLDNLKRVLKPGGLLLVSTPNIKVFGQRNPYHLHEYEHSELEKSLKQYFAQVNMLAQRNALASYIETDGEGQRVSISGVKGEAEYLIALASDQDLPLKQLSGLTIAVNQPAWQTFRNNPGLKLIDKAYRLVIKVPGAASLLKRLKK